MKLSNLSKGLVGRWMLDATHKARDLSGFENHGTPQGGLTIGGATDSHGQAGGATTSGGLATKFVSVASTTLAASAGYSIVIRTQYIGTTSVPICDGTTNNCVMLVSSGKLRLYAGGVNRLDAAVTWVNGWYTIVIVVSGGVSTAYLNGNVCSPTGTSADFTFTELCGHTHVGSSCDFRIYNRALSQTEITLLYDSYKPRTVMQSINESGLLLYLDAGNKSSYPGSGAAWKDISGNGYHVTLTGSPTYSGANGGILTFNGSSQYGATTATPFTANSDFSFAVWAKATSGVNPSLLFGNKTEESASQGGAFNYSTVMSAVVKSATDYRGVSSGVSAPYEWKHFACRKTGGYIYIYVNGSYITGASITGTVTDALNYFAIAGRSGVYWPGSIAQILVYQRALSAAEILQNYNATKGRFGL